MAGEWPTLPLRKANVTLIDCDHRTPPASEAGYPYVAIPQLRGGRVDLSDVRRIKPEHFVEWTRKAKPSANDVILSRRCNPGETAVVPPNLELALGQNLVLLRADGTKVYPPFLRWLVRGPEWWNQINKFLNVGAVFDSLRCADVPNFELRVPPLPEQRAIAHILGTLDDKIELNRRMNETLEAMARALFKSWFVDFDPVRAKADGRDPGLPKHHADLFPDSFEDSELGKIPKTWRASVLGEEVTRCGGRIQTGPFGSQLHAADYMMDGVPVVMPKDLFQRRVSTLTISMVGLGDAQRLSRHRLQEGDIVYSRRGDVERHGLVRSRETGWLCGTGCLLLRLGPEWPSALFASIALDRPETRAWITQHAIGATMPNLNTGILARVPIVVPSDEMLCAFNRVVQPLADRVIANDARSDTLVSLRDTLLPRLISGELRVKDADQFISTEFTS